MANHLISAVAAILAVACVLPPLTLAARDISAYKKSFVVQGRVFCDTCRAGFETPMSTYIKGAKVRVECRSKATGAKTCSFEGTTDHTGTYNIVVADEHEHETCQTVAISSSEPGCQTLLESRKLAPVFLSHNNGIASDTRYANAVGFVKDSALSACTELLATYKQYELEYEN